MKIKLLIVALFVTAISFGQIAAWDFTGENTVATSTAEVFNVSLDASVVMTRGAGATASAGANSFRTTGFQNNGISTANTDYFQITLSATPGNTLSLSTIDARFAGTAGFAAAPGVANQFAYSLDGTNFTLIGAPQIFVVSPATLTQINLSGIAALQGVADTTTITLRYYASGQTTTGGWGFNSPALGTYGLAIGGTVTPTVTGIQSVASGFWDAPTTWQGGNIPDPNENAIIRPGHTVTMNNAFYATRDAGTTTVVDALGNLVTPLAITNNGTMTINGTFIVQAGGTVTGNNLQYGPSSGLRIAHANSTTMVLGASQRIWPIANPPFNVVLFTNSPVQLTTAVGPVNGTLTLSAGLNVAVANALTVNGILALFNGGNVIGNGPLYGAASSLQYNTGTTIGRGMEWSALGLGTIGVTAGYPNNVIIQGNTTLNYVNTVVPNSVLDKATAGNLTIDSGSTLNMNTGSVPLGGTLTVGGNLLINGPTGAMNLGVGANDDLRLRGNLTVTTGATFNANTKRVFFINNAATQIITGPNVVIPYLVFQPASGSTTVQLNSGTVVNVSAPVGGNAIVFNSATDVFSINGGQLIIGTAGVANTISGLGTFSGSLTSRLSLLGTGSVGTLRFAINQSLGNFTINRTSGAVACVMGSPLTIATNLNLTAGILDLDTTIFTMNSTATISGASVNNFIIADNAVGGILRRQYNALGSFTFPIGDKTGTIDYSPATVNLTAATGLGTTSFIDVAVNDSKHPNMDATTHFISRFWVVNRSGTINAPTYSFTSNYLPADINGTETTSFSQQWNGSTWAQGTFLGANVLFFGGSTTLPTSATPNVFSGGSRNQEINIRQGVTSYGTGTSNPIFPFGNVATGSSSTITFTIENLGNSTLSLISNTAVTAPFSATIPFIYTTNISSFGSVTFTITFAPTVAGPFSGSITFANNDSDEGSYVLGFSGTGTGSTLSDIFAIAGSDPATISSTSIGTIATVTDGTEVWRFRLRDGGAAAPDTDALPTIMTALTITQNGNDAIGNWDQTIQNIVLVNLNTNTIIAPGVVTASQIQFTGLSVTAVDNGSVLLGLRLTLRCPLGVGAIDGDDFGFTISNPNVTFAPTGSGNTTFTQSTVNGRLAIAIVASQLRFTTQPITTGVNTPMSTVLVAATDACGNRDLGFTGVVSLTSSGTMTGSPINVAAASGLATFIGITHTVVGTDITLTATAAGVTAIGSTLFDIAVVTVLAPGDLAVLGVSTNITGGADQISFVCFRDLLPGTKLLLTDNGYERVFANQWGGTEGVITITRTGSLLPKGTIITIETSTTNPNVTTPGQFDVYTCGAIDTNWTKTAESGGSVGGFNLNNNDDIYFMQGGLWTNNIGHTSTYSGTVLYGWTESGWQTAPSGNTCIAPPNGDPNDCTAWSTLYPGLECFSNIAPSGNGFVKFDDPDSVDFSATTRGKFDWIALINDTANWDTYADNAAYTAGGFNYRAGCTLVPLDTDIYVNGRWSGRRNSNWFNCENWDTLIVPDATVDVQIIDNSFLNSPAVDATAPFAANFGFIARARNLTLAGKKLDIIGNVNNRLEVHGDLVIQNSAADSALDMNDGNNATADGQLFLYGNWNNNKNNNAFDEGNGTVHFVGATPQIINNVVPQGTEQFFNVVLDNNFDTAVSNDLFANGNLTVATTRNVSVDAAGYLRVNNRLTNNGNITIQSNGQLIQVNDTDTNNGDYTGTRFTVRRNYTAKDIDYVYWGAPTKSFAVANLPNGLRYEWNPIFPNTNGTFGNWITPSTANMAEGKGYIARTFNGAAVPATNTFNFFGQPNNGLINLPISRGAYFGDGITTGLNYDAEPANPNNVLTTRWDDNWNLVGNPYPSALNVERFLALNPSIEGFINIWTHQSDPTSGVDPYYFDFVYNYNTNDYITHNGLGTISGPAGFNGNIASGQGFFVLMSDGPATTGSLQFRNEMRSNLVTNTTYNNSQFYRNTNGSDEVETVSEKSRVWLDLVSPQGSVNRTLLGYTTAATNTTDRLYDAVTNAAGLKIYSFVDDNQNQPYCIQGRALPFDIQDQVKLGISVSTSGNYSIAIAAVDGLFLESNQEIYLEDKLLGITHLLNDSPYLFTASRGIVNDRFILRYTSQSLSNPDITRDDAVIVSSNLQTLTITSRNETIAKVTVFDILGRKIYDNNQVSDVIHQIDNLKSQQTVVVKIVLQNGVVVNRKAIVP